jgi:hypothetical protein
MFGEHRLPHQERRASARRGTENRTCNGDRFSWSDYVHQARSDGTPRLAYANRSRRRSWWTHANGCKCAASLCTGDSFHHHGWLTPAAPGARRRSAENSDIRGAQTHVLQERRPSARRGVRNRPRAVRIERCSATSKTTTESGVVSPPRYGNRAGSTERFLPNEDVRMPRGLTPPALGGPAVRTFAGETATCATYERSFTGAATVSPPWFGNRTCNGDQFSRGGSDYIHHTRSDGAPRLAHVSRSWCRT